MSSKIGSMENQAHYSKQENRRMCVQSQGLAQGRINRNLNKKDVAEIVYWKDVQDAMLSKN